MAKQRAGKMTPLEAVMASLAGIDLGKGAKAGAVGSSADSIVQQLNAAMEKLATMGPSTSPLRDKLRRMATKISSAAASGGGQVPGMVAEAQSLLGQVGEKLGLRKYESGLLSALQGIATEGRKAEEATKQRLAATDEAKEAEQAAIAADRRGKIAGLRGVFKDTVAKEAKVAGLEKGLLGGVRGKLFRGLEPLIGGKWGETAAKMLPELAVFALISQMTGLFEKNQQVNEGLSQVRAQGMSTDDYLEEAKNQRAAMARAAGMANGNQQAMQAMLQQMTPPGEVMFGTVPQAGQAQGSNLQDILGQLAL